MLRYRLDELGWYQFEMLVQSLLKAELGLAVETWGGPSDNGRDAYADGPLSFPDRGTASEGPFIFQVKFVEGANAAGARFEERLRKALRAECSAIHSRRAAGIWQDPKHYVLLTNAPLTPTLRATLREVLAEALPRSKVHFRGGGDICDLLDTHKAIAHSFPELLSLRDLSFLLSDVVNKEVLERSRAAIDLAREAAHYFVATSAYHNAYQLLTQYGFVVLDGPPEMGKTTIAHIIALLQVLRGWHAIDCRNPDDFFAGFEPERSQIFIIDDAFGRTEYDVSLGRQWERELSKLMPRVDDNHWIVFTSRTQVLLRALDDLDVSGAARIFPDPAKLIVNAADLSVEERARILYRHVRAVELSAPMREIVRSEARRIVLDRNFTPERMRLLAFTLASDDVRGATKAIISLKMQDIIRNPSKAMRRSFRSLEQQYRLVLIALLDCDRSGTLYRLSSSFGRLYGGSIGETLLGLVDDLLGVFLRPTQPVAPLGLNWYVQVDWIHPSFRDLVIDELSADDDLRRRFLRTASVTGIALAVSTGGGAMGEREFPLVTTRENWKNLRERAIELAAEPKSAAGLLEVFLAILKRRDVGAARSASVGSIVSAICAEIEEEIWSSPTVEALIAYRRACDAVKRSPSDPGIEKAWEIYAHDLVLTLDRDLDDPEIVEEWCRVVKLVADGPSRLFSEPSWQRRYSEDLEFLVRVVRTRLNSAAEHRHLSRHVAADIAEWLRDLPAASSVTAEELDELCDHCEEYGGQESRLIPNAMQPEVRSSKAETAMFDIEQFFVDL